MQAESIIPCMADVFQGLEAARDRRRQRSRRRAVSVLPVADQLENRTLLSVNLIGSTLSIVEGSGNDKVEVFQVNGSPTRIYVVENNGVIQGNAAWTASAINSVSVSAGAGDDTVIGQITTVAGRDPLTEPMTIRGGDGIDSLNGATAPDIVYGDDGNDEVYGFGDNDVLYGGYGGADYIEGGNGNDVLYGGNAVFGPSNEIANDTLLGQDGNDVLYGEGGDDELYGDVGNDQLYGGSGNDFLVGDNGNDYLAGEDGNDSLAALDGSNFVDSLLGGAGSDVIWDQNNGIDILLDTLPG